MESDPSRIGETVKKIEKLWINGTKVKKEMQVVYFFVIDEFAALRIALGKKALTEINDSLRRDYFNG